MNITIAGQTPAQKNGKNIVYNRSTGKPFIISNDTVKAWQKSALLQLSGTQGSFVDRVKIDYYFYCKDMRKRDIDNMVATVNDTLQAAGIISGDHWQVLELGSAKAELDKENPRCELTITKI